MDPRKTVVIADFDKVVRSASEPNAAPLPAAEERPAIPQWGVETLAWPSGGEAKDVVPRERTSDVRQTLAQAARAAKGTPTVLIGRTVLTGSEPRGVSLAKTQVWRREVTVSEDFTDGERARAEVHIDEAVMQRLSAEVWAGQAPSGSHMLVTTVRRSIVDVSTSLVETRAHEVQPAIIARADRVTKVDASAKTDVLARYTDDNDPIRIPRLFRMPETKTIRIACLALCIASAGALAIWPPKLHQPAGPARPAAAGVATAAAVSGESEPVEVQSTWRPRVAAAAVAASPTANNAVVARSAQRAPTADREQDSAADGRSATSGERERPTRARAAFAVKSSNAGATAGKTAPAGASSGASPRAAIDALIAGKRELALTRYRALAKGNPEDPAYAAAVRILED